MAAELLIHSVTANVAFAEANAFSYTGWRVRTVLRFRFEIKGEWFSDSHTVNLPKIHIRYNGSCFERLSEILNYWISAFESVHYFARIHLRFRAEINVEYYKDYFVLQCLDSIFSDKHFIFNVKFMAAVKGLSCATPRYGDLFLATHSVICALISGKTERTNARNGVTQSCLFDIGLIFFLINHRIIHLYGPMYSIKIELVVYKISGINIW